MKKDKKEKDVFGFEKAINTDAINNLSIEDLKKIDNMFICTIKKQK